MAGTAAVPFGTAEDIAKLRERHGMSPIANPCKRCNGAGSHRAGVGVRECFKCGGTGEAKAVDEPVLQDRTGPSEINCTGKE